MSDRVELQKALGDDEHKQMEKERNAVESIPSIFRRKYGIDHIDICKKPHKVGLFWHMPCL